ncbi:hypothetical protein PHISCL_11166, partial [Aspergillus sclerotialis]
MEADVRPGAIRSELAVEHPRTQLLVDVTPHGLIQVSVSHCWQHSKTGFYLLQFLGKGGTPDPGVNVTAGDLRDDPAGVLG